MHFKKAIELFNQCRNVNPRDVSVLMNLALCYARSGDREKAIITTKDALALEPDNNALKYNLDLFLSGVKLNGIVLIDKMESLLSVMMQRRNREQTVNRALLGSK